MSVVDKEKYSGEREIRNGGGRSMAIYNMMLRLGLTEKVTFNQM